MGSEGDLVAVGGEEDMGIRAFPVVIGDAVNDCQMGVGGDTEVVRGGDGRRISWAYTFLFFAS